MENAPRIPNVPAFRMMKGMKISYSMDGDSTYLGGISYYRSIYCAPCKHNADTTGDVQWRLVVKCGQLFPDRGQRSFQYMYRSDNNSSTCSLESDGGLGTINEEKECSSTSLFVPSSCGDDVKEIALHSKDYLIKESKGIALSCSVELAGIIRPPGYTEICLYHMM